MNGTKKAGAVAATGGLLIAACAACCAPLIAPLVAPPLLALVAVGGAGLALAGQIGIAVVLMAGGVVYLWLRHRRLERAKAAACACPPNSACNIDTSESCAK